MPVTGQRDYTIDALNDCLQQSADDVRLLIINQAVPTPLRQELEAIAEQTAMDRAGATPRPEIFLWHHEPTLPSLAATWNRALAFVWETGATKALVVNNDVRLRHDTYSALDAVMGHSEALFVSAVGVGSEDAWREPSAEIMFHPPGHPFAGHPVDKGGPDFSCFLISRACHERYPFDEGFIPAYCEDLDYHRRLMLGGDGARIFSVNLPFWHRRSGTLEGLTPARRQALEQAISRGSRTYYAKKWGGPVNQETFREPFGKIHGDLGVVLDEPPVEDGSATTPALQAAVREAPAQEASDG